MTVRSRLQLLSRYLQYRVTAEWAALVERNRSAAYLHRCYAWWRYTLPEYIDPSGLPAPPGYPAPAAREPPWTVPVARVLRRVPVWERKLDNLLLFGHTLPTSPEVQYRASYLAWLEQDSSKARWLPIEQIAADADPSQVPVYKHPLAHETAQHMFRSRLAGRPSAIPLPSLQNFVQFEDADGQICVCRPQDLTRKADIEVADAAITSHTGKGLDMLPYDRMRNNWEDDQSSADMRAAQESLKEAFADMRGIFNSSGTPTGSTMPALQQRIFSFAHDRVKTFREALSEFVSGYQIGAQEVETGKVDIVKDSKRFWSQMMHTLPAFLEPPLSTHKQGPSGRLPPTPPSADSDRH